MKAARLYSPGEPLRVEDVAKPEVRPHDVVVEVAACGVIPNMNAVLAGLPSLYLPPLPAIVGLDAAGMVTEVGAGVTRVKPGDRVYINPLLSCGACRYCRTGRDHLCVSMTFRGYFGFTPESERLYKEYPWGGYSEFTLAPEGNLVLLPSGVTFEQAARFGYLGTSYAALKQGGTRAGSWILINGVTGTLGVAAAIFALGMGASRVLGIGRNREILDRVKALSPHRISTLALGDEPIGKWIRAHTDDDGPDLILDCTTRTTPSSILQEAMSCLQKGGVAVTIGGLAEKLGIPTNHFVRSEWQFRGSCWFRTFDAEEMAEMANRGVVDLSVFDTQVFALKDINTALAAVRAGSSGFSNVVVSPRMT